MVLIKTSTHEPLKIVDGQQRTITLTILMILIRDICRSLGNEPDATRIEAFLQFSKISSTESQPTLRLNQNNNNYFVENIFPYADPEEKVNYLKPPLKTNEHILDAYKILYKNNIIVNKVRCLVVGYIYYLYQMLETPYLQLHQVLLILMPYIGNIASL